ncbi:UNVERIFIED_CONTAM: Retrovirus-related Pol polyprotein from transposon RE1 [Sesamum indicum]
MFYENIFPFKTSKDDNSDIVCPLPVIDQIDESETSNKPLANDVIEPEADTHIPRRSNRPTSKPSWMNDYECYNSENSNNLHMSHENIFPFKTSKDDNSDIVCPLPVIDQIDESETSNKPLANDVIEPEADTHIPRRSNRPTSKPSWMNDYECYNSENSNNLHMSHVHSCFVENLSSIQEPKDFKQAQEQANWRKAMQEEINALERNRTWKITDLPSDKRAIGCKWLYKVKLNPNGTIERYKARLVAKGYSQVEGEDYNDCFAPVAKAVTVRLFLAVAVGKKWPIHHLDVNNAFLHGTLDEDIYMEPPQGYKIPHGKVCKLGKSLYGLKQASRKWNEEFTNKIREFGFEQCSHDHCLFIKGTDTSLIALLIYVDDILITAASESSIITVKDYLDDLFTVKHLGNAKYFLGLELARSTEGLVVTQRKYTQDILKDVGLNNGRHVATPLPPGLKLTVDTGAALTDPSRYRRLVGRLLYLSFTRPDLCYAVQQLSQHLQHPCEKHWEAAIHVVRYLKGTISTGLYFPSTTDFSLKVFCDADWAACQETRRSLSGFCIFVGETPISWKTKKQTTVARSSAEAEYRSMATTTCEVTWLVYLLKNFGVNVKTPIPFYCDNKAALHITANPVFHERTKHLEIDCHVVRNKFKEGLIQPTYVVSRQQIADAFTKSLSCNSFLHLRSKLSLVTLNPSLSCGGGDETHPYSPQEQQPQAEE